MIRFENVTKTFGSQTVLNQISFSIPTGNICGIIGSSGTGKSVTLRHIVGLLKPDSGNIYIQDQNIVTCRSRELQEIRNHIGMLFQSGALLNWLSVYNNVALPLVEKSQLKPEEIDPLVMEALSLVELQNMGEKMPSEISGGMKKRVGLARAIITKPQIILYDEPTSGLDPISSRKIDNLIETLSKKIKATSVIVTHDLASAYAICNQIIMLHEGQVIFNGTVEEFKNSTQSIIQDFIKAQFLSSPI